MVNIVRRYQIEPTQMPPGLVRAGVEQVAELTRGNKASPISAKDVAKVEEMLETDTLPEIGAAERKLLETQLPRIWSALAPEPAPPGRRAFASIVRIGALRDPALRASALQVAKAFATGPDTGELDAASNSSEAAAPSPPEVSPQAATPPDAPMPAPDHAPATVSRDQVKAALAAQERGDLPADIDPAHLELLDVFLETGKGGLVVRNDFRIGGVSYPEAFPLEGKATDATIQCYEAMFSRVSFDRIYVEDGDGKLFVLVRDRGTPRAQQSTWSRPGAPVTAGMGVTIGSDPKPGRVLLVRDVTNSLYEATVGVWARIVGSMVDYVRGSQDVEPILPLPNAAGTLAKAAQRDPRASRWLQLMTVGSVSGAAGFAAYTGLASPTTVAVVAGSLTAVSGASMMYARRRQDKSLLYYAAGVVLDRPERIL